MTAPPYPTGEPGDGPRWAPPAQGPPGVPPPAVRPGASPPTSPPPTSPLPTSPLPTSPLPTHPVPQHPWPHYHALGWRPAGPPPRPRRGGWYAFGLALLATVLLVPVAASRDHPTSSARLAQPGGGAPPAAGQAGGPHQFTTLDVRDLLDRYATALVRHDRGRFLAQLDPHKARLVAAQRRLFDNLRQLDLATLAFVPQDASLPAPDPTRPGAYTQGWVEAWRQLQIRGIDPVPGAQYFRLQLAVAAGRLIITDMAPAANAASRRQPSPWDVAALRVLHGHHVVVAGTADVAGRLGDVLRAAEAAIADAGPCWPANWQHTFTIFATGDHKAFATWFRSSFTSSEFIGYEIGLPVLGGDGQVVPGREDDVPQVVIDVPGAMRAPLGFRQLLEHEMTHAASGAERNADTETWAVEGYADFVAFHSGALRQANRGGTAYRAYHSRAGLTVRLPANADFYGRSAALNYDLAFLAFWYLRQRYGQPAVVSFFAAANRDGNATGLLQQRFHLSSRQFVDQWSRWTFAQLR
jgi:hypothetical protein